MNELKGRKLARKALEIGAITLSPDDPYTWASGFRMPIYNDNRKHLRFPENRFFISSAFFLMMKNDRNNVDFDSIAGTSTAGIAPATTFAQSINVPVAIIKDDKLIEYSPDFVHSSLGDLTNNSIFHKYNLVVSTCPDSIIPGVFLANQKDLPFAYVRSQKKGHGLQQQTEGIIKEGDRAILIDFYVGDSYADGAIAALKEQWVDIVSVVSKKMVPPEVQKRKRKIVQIEDLVSTGGSCVTEIAAHKNRGDEVNDCLAIFDYEFPETREKFREVGCNVRPIFGYSTLLEVALEQKAITSDQYKMLQDWRNDPWNWGAKNGFPKVEKK